jgi:hypothetical protein
MSILNAFVVPEVALLGVDSEAFLPDGTIEAVCKLIALPHISAALGFRGVCGVFWASSPAFVGFMGSFDELAEAVPEIIKASVIYCRQHYQTSENVLETNFTLVGYSFAAGRMVGHAYVRKAGSDDIEVTRDFPQAIAPYWSREDFPSSIRADKPGMIAIAQHQCRLARERGPADFPAGDRFFIAEVRRHSILIEQAFEFSQRSPAEI